MPRDGLQQYAPPAGTNGIPNYTVESARYNTFVADITADQNNARPIVAGGTAASDARTAMINLSGEISGQTVTNYDSFPFVNGTFHSSPGATSAPNGTDFFAGVCYGADIGAMVLEVRSVGSPIPGPKWVRSRTGGGGAWGAWTLIPSTADLDAAYVNVTGDTMTGALINPAKGNQFGTLGGTLATASVLPADANIKYYDSGSGNWAGVGVDANGAVWFRVGTSGAPIPAFVLRADQSATFIGATQHFGPVGCVGGFSSSSTGGAFSVNIRDSGGAGNNKYIRNNAGVLETWNNAGSNMISSLTDTGVLSAVSGSFSVASVSGSAPWLASSGLCAEHATTALWPVAVKGVDRGIIYLATAAVSNLYAYFTQATTANAVGSIGGTTTATSYNTSSSAELKEDLKSFDAGVIIDNTNVYDFAWRSTKERSYGVLAQQAIDVYPMAVTHVEKVSDEIGEYWGVDYSKYVPVLLQELKALRARVAELEVATGMRPATPGGKSS